ncbi:unnamed protein product, partial [Iphiclides podalirius]
MSIFPVLERRNGCPANETRYVAIALVQPYTIRKIIIISLVKSELCDYEANNLRTDRSSRHLAKRGLSLKPGTSRVAAWRHRKVHVRARGASRRIA